jgi:hypothetical protein
MPVNRSEFCYANNCITAKMCILIIKIEHKYKLVFGNNLELRIKKRKKIHLTRIEPQTTRMVDELNQLS